MSTEGRSLKMIGDYDHDHHFHYCITPPEKRPRFTIDDCPKEHRVYDNLNTYRRSGGTGKLVKFYQDVEPEARSVARKESRAAKAKVAPKRDRSETRKPKPMGRPTVAKLKLFTGTKVHEVEPQAVLRRLHKRQIVGQAYEAMRCDGFHKFQDGAVVWFAERSEPKIVSHALARLQAGLLSRAIEMNAKEA